MLFQRGKKVCAFTGHRPHRFPWKQNEDDLACIRLKAALAEYIEQLSEDGYYTFLTGMAQGVDLWAAQEVLILRTIKPSLHLQLGCILPCKTQAERWSADYREQYQEILQQADFSVYINETYQPSCMMKRNYYLVDHCQLLLAVYDGEDRGGTAATVRYARKQERPIWILHPLTLELDKL